MRFLRGFLILIAAAGGAISCESPPSGPDAVTLLRSTTSFGFCRGYCRATLELTSEGMVYVQESRQGDLPPIRRTAPLSAPEWNELIVAVNRQAFERLPATVGCPDCADGGAESLEVISADWQDAVTFEYNAPMPDLQPLLSRVRALRSRFGADPRDGDRATASQR